MMTITRQSTQRLLAAFALVIILLTQTHCTAPKQEQVYAQASIPPDFAILFNVVGIPDHESPLQQYAQFILEPNRQLRVATGPGADRQYFPGPTWLATPHDMNALFDHIATSKLLSEPTSPTGRAFQQGQFTPDEVPVYRVSIRARGVYHQYITTPAESPPTTRLLEMLVLMSEGKPAAGRLRDHSQSQASNP